MIINYITCFYIITNTIAWFFIIKNWLYIKTNAIAWFYSYPPEKIRDTLRWLCAGGKHTATCDRVTNFLTASMLEMFEE